MVVEVVAEMLVKVGYDSVCILLGGKGARRLDWETLMCVCVVW